LDKTEKKDNVVDDEPLVDKDEKVIEPEPSEELTFISGENVDAAVATVEPELEEPMIIFRKIDLGPSVASRVFKYTKKAFGVYQKMKYGERLTLEQYLKRMKVKPGNEREDRAAIQAWTQLFDEHKIPVPQFFKPPRGDSSYGWLPE